MKGIFNFRKNDMHTLKNMTTKDMHDSYVTPPTQAVLKYLKIDDLVKFKFSRNVRIQNISPQCA